MGTRVEYSASVGDYRGDMSPIELEVGSRDGCVVITLSRDPGEGRPEVFQGCRLEPAEAEAVLAALKRASDAATREPRD